MLAEILIRLVVVEVVLVAVTVAICIDRDVFASASGDVPRRLRSVAPEFAFLAIVLALNKVVREVGEQLSWLVNWNITDEIYAVEGAFVAHVQSIATPELTATLSFTYLYGYAFLLVFPLVAYVLIDDLESLRELVVAYALNYGIGLLAYVLFVSYGPRNLIPDLVDPLLYRTYPTTQLLTREVNTSVNVFPSLHTSLSATVLGFAWITRARLPRWLVIATPFTIAVIFSTMYLGIHWGTDVIGGLILAWFSVYAARRRDWQIRAGQAVSRVRPRS